MKKIFLILILILILFPINSYSMISKLNNDELAEQSIWNHQGVECDSVSIEGNILKVEPTDFESKMPLGNLKCFARQWVDIANYVYRTNGDPKRIKTCYLIKNDKIILIYHPNNLCEI